jgi:hypothetical protein
MKVDRRSFRSGLIWLLAAIILGIQPGCRQTPSYSDIKVDKGGGLANTNAAAPQARPSIQQENPLAPAPDSSLAPAPDSSIAPNPDSGTASAPESTPSPDASVSASSTAPSYLDQKTGQIKNLPLYPGASARGLQYGPINGTSQVTVQARTRAPFEKVTAFYDRVVKENGWIIDDNSREQNSYVWQLRRSEGDRAAIRVDRDQLGRVTIGLARTN